MTYKILNYTDVALIDFPRTYSHENIILERWSHQFRNPKRICHGVLTKINPLLSEGACPKRPRFSRNISQNNVKSDPIDELQKRDFVVRF